MKDGAVGINESLVEGTDESMLVYPNPAQNEIKVDLKNIQSKASDNLMYTLTTIEGKTVLTGKIAAKQQLLSIDVSSLQSGIYLVSINKNNKLATQQKIVVQR
jgi:hypothetical protein